MFDNIKTLMFNPTQAGTEWVSADCNEHCECVDGEPLCESYPCSENEECSVKNGVRKCHCEDHYVHSNGICNRGKYPENKDITSYDDPVVN